MSVRVGVLGIQGAIEEHIEMVREAAEKLGVKVEVLRVKERAIN